MGINACNRIYFCKHVINLVFCINHAIVCITFLIGINCDFVLQPNANTLNCNFCNVNCIETGLYPPKFNCPFCAQYLYSTFQKYDLLRLQIDGLTNNKTKNAFHKETVILNHIRGDPMRYNLRN